MTAATNIIFTRHLLVSAHRPKLIQCNNNNNVRRRLGISGVMSVTGASGAADVLGMAGVTAGSTGGMGDTAMRAGRVVNPCPMLVPLETIANLAMSPTTTATKNHSTVSTKRLASSTTNSSMASGMSHVELSPENKKRLVTSSSSFWIRSCLPPTSHCTRSWIIHPLQQQQQQQRNMSTKASKDTSNETISSSSNKTQSNSDEDRTAILSSTLPDFDYDYTDNGGYNHGEEKEKDYDVSNSSSNGSTNGYNNEPNSKNRYTPKNQHQQRLWEYTQSLIATDDDDYDTYHNNSNNPSQFQNDPTTTTYSVGSLPIGHLHQISNCIGTWIQSGEYHYLGAEMAMMLLKRLIVERGGGRNRRNGSENHGGNVHVSWDMYRLDLIVTYLNALYIGREFYDRMLSIVSTFEEEYSPLSKADDDLDSSLLEVPYKSIIAIICKCGTPHAAATAEEILQRFETRILYETDYYHSNPPTVEAYNAVINCWKTSGCDHYPNFCEPKYQYNRHPPSNLLSHMLDLYLHDPNTITRIRPFARTFNTVISSLAKQASPQASSRNNGKQCFEHLQQMLKLYDNGFHDCAPDIKTFSNVLNALAKAGGDGDEGRAYMVLQEMLRLGRDRDKGQVEQQHDVSMSMSEENLANNEDDFSSSDGYKFDVLPKSRHFNSVLALMANSKRIDVTTLERAKKIVQIMEQLAREEQQDDQHSHMKQLANEVQEAEQHSRQYTPKMFQQLQELEEISTNISSKPDTVTYNTLIKIADQARKPEVAEEILREMIEKSSNVDSLVRPDRITFNTVLSAWSKSKHPDASNRATKLLELMHEMAEQGNADLKPDRVSVTSVINSLVQSARGRRDAPIQVERIIERMEQSQEAQFKPDVVTYTLLIKCWSECGCPKAASRALEIIDTLHRRYQEEGYEECKPDTYAYNVALDTIAKSQLENAAELAEALLRRMQDLSDRGDSDLMPTVETFATVMYALSQSNNSNAAEKVEKILQMMHDSHDSGNGAVVPNAIAYSTCILAWRKSGHRIAGERADALLTRMEKYYNQGLDDVKPNVIVYTNAMEAWINSKHPDALTRVEAIFDRMLERSQGGDRDSAPTATAFNVVLKAIRHSSEPSKHRKAQLYLNKMSEMYENGDIRVKPNIRTFNAFFSACAETQGSPETKRAAFSMVLNALVDLREKSRLHPDLYTWPAIWKSCENLLDVNKDMDWINHIFELCVKSGSINELLFSNIRNFLPSSYLQKKLKTTEDIRKLTVHDLPEDWTKNAKLGKKKLTKKRKDARSA